MFNHISWPFSDVQTEMFLIGVWQHLNFVKKIFILNCVGLNISVPDREGTGGSCLAMVSESWKQGTCSWRAIGKSLSNLFVLVLKPYWHWHIFGLLHLGGVRKVAALSKVPVSTCVLVTEIGCSSAEFLLPYNETIFLILNLIGSLLWLEQLVIFCNCSFHFLSSGEHMNSSDRLLSGAKEIILRCFKVNK